MIRIHEKRCGRSRASAALVLAGSILLLAHADAFGMAAVFAVRPDNTLLRFNSNAPTNILASVPITGLQVGETLVGIDFRPATGGLYGVGSTGRLYVLNTGSGAATQIGSGTFDPVLLGTSFGVDFNPAVDRLRVVSNADQNLRINPDSGSVAAVDATLSFASGDVNAGFDPSVVGLAYTELISGSSTLTTLYGIDAFRNVLVRIGGDNGVPSPNGGALATIGSLGIEAGEFVGFDTLPNGITLAAVDVAGISQLFTINLMTGAATLVGTIGDGSAISGLAIAPPGRVQFSAATFEEDEDAGQATITVRRVGGSFGTAIVEFLVADGTATAPGDYTAATGTVTFGDTETEKTFTVALQEDGDTEADETVALTIFNAQGGATLGAITSATLTILDDESGGPGGGCGGGLCGVGFTPLVPLMLLGLRRLRSRRE